jgi:hypothetical protein
MDRTQDYFVTVNTHRAAARAPAFGQGVDSELVRASELQAIFGYLTRVLLLRQSKIINEPNCKGSIVLVTHRT